MQLGGAISFDDKPDFRIPIILLGLNQVTCWWGFNAG